MAKTGQRDFSGGWRPGDDAINGAPNGLLRMNNVDLDTNGALSLIGGTTVVGSAYGSNLHTLYSRTMNGVRTVYSADTAGSILRNNTSIGAGGSATRAAFGTAFNFALCCSGNTRKKDSGSGTPANLGVTAPAAAPAWIPFGRETDGPLSYIADLTANFAMFVGTGAAITSNDYPSGGGHSRPSPIQYLQVTADANGDAVFQTYNGTSDPHNLSVFTTDGGSATDNDIIPFFGYTPTPQGCSLQIDILLQAGNAYADKVANFFSYKITNLADLDFDPYTGVFQIYLRRKDFEYYGNGEKSWNTAYGVRLTFKGTDSQVINFLGDRADPVAALGGSQLSFYGGTHAQNGVYEFAQVDVNNTGSYLALSPMGPISAPIHLVQMRAYLDITVPVDTQVNEVWIFARSTGGANAIGDASILNQWYRVAKQTASLGSNIYVSQGDLDTLALNIPYNQNLTTIASSGISDAILEIIGPVQGRWYYFTANFMYPSDINNPDLVDTTKGVRLTGSNNELFMWARQIDKATILVGTSTEIYVLGGTFATLPDYTIDIFYYPLGCKYPPIAYDADVYNGDVVYLAADGWRIINTSKENPLMVAPQLDILYKGINRHSYTAPNLKVSPGSVRFPVCIAKNKIWTFITGTSRSEVFDFTRKYWRTFNYILGDATCATTSQDGQVLAFYSSDRKLRELDVKTTKLIDGTGQQTVDLLFTIKDGDMPRQRKDTSVFKSRLYTAATNLSVNFLNETTLGSGSYTLNSAVLGADKFLDLSQDSRVGLCKTYQVAMVGLVNDFVLEDWEILFEPRPEQVSYLKLLNKNFGTAARKRVRVWPHVIDTLGNIVNATPYVDNVASGSVVWNTSNKDTRLYQFITDVSGIDYGMIIHCPSGLFEYYGELNPEIVQLFPIAKRYDQLGPEELFRFGKILKVEFRILPVGGTSIPYQIYFQDTNIESGNLAVTNNIDATYVIPMPKGTAGNVLRIELGPTSFDFHRFYTRLLIDQTGTDTENRWMTLQ